MADQPLNPNYKYGAITTSLLALPDTARAAAKSTQINNFVVSRLPYTFTLRGITVTVIKAGITPNGIIWFVVTATRTGVNLRVDNPLYFQNPPIMAPDGTTYTDSTGTHPVMTENIVAALQEMVVQTIEIQNKY